MAGQPVRCKPAASSWSNTYVSLLSIVQGLARQRSPAHVKGGRINKTTAVTLGSAHMIPRAVSSTSGVTTDNDQVWYLQGKAHLSTPLYLSRDWWQVAVPLPGGGKETVRPDCHLADQFCCSELYVRSVSCIQLAVFTLPPSRNSNMILSHAQLNKALDGSPEIN